MLEGLLITVPEPEAEVDLNDWSKMIDHNMFVGEADTRNIYTRLILIRSPSRVDPPYVSYSRHFVPQASKSGSDVMPLLTWIMHKNRKLLRICELYRARRSRGPSRLHPSNNQSNRGDLRILNLNLPTQFEQTSGLRIKSIQNFCSWYLKFIVSLPESSDQVLFLISWWKILLLSRCGHDHDSVQVHVELQERRLDAGPLSSHPIIPGRLSELSLKSLNHDHHLDRNPDVAFRTRFPSLEGLKFGMFLRKDNFPSKNPSMPSGLSTGGKLLFRECAQAVKRNWRQSFDMIRSRIPHSEVHGIRMFR